MLRSLITIFDYIVVTIEEAKNLSEMKLEELQASLEAHEMRLQQRNSEREKENEQALQSRFIKKAGKEKSKQRNNLAGDGKSSKNIDSKGVGNKYSGKKVDTKEVQCYNCQVLTTMLETVEERKLQGRKIVMKLNMHELEIVILLMCC